MFQRSPRFYIFLSIAAALITMTTKFIGYFITGSVGLFSDAAESVVNLIAALIALWALTVAARPADSDHAYGHTKSEYFSSGAEGALVILAAIFILVEALPRLFDPQPLEQVGLGLSFSVFGALINAAVAFILLQAGRRTRSVTLKADAHHLLTDVWTTVGVLVGVILVTVTHWLILDPLIAIVVAANVVWTGIRLLRETGLGLLDTSLPAEDLQKIEALFEVYRQRNIEFHALRTRSAGSRRFISFHVLVPGQWSVLQGHQTCEEIERSLRHTFPETTIFTHLEAREDPASWLDQKLDRDVEEEELAQEMPSPELDKEPNAS